ncbi:hypothetical protein B0H34DRAFT_793176 [Crassisporium funariophilum]|nr:hypothetical protein B0H34DRAFT_793176 [Crassisporium funariophilum]
MSTSEPLAAEDSFMDFAGDQTQPTQETILSALATLTATASPVKTEQQQPEQPPPSEYDTLTAQLAENPHNPEAWRRVVDMAEASGDITKISATYDALLKQYPNTASAQIPYINHFLNSESTFEKAEDLFKKFLRTSPCVELWVFYLTYVRRMNVGNAQRDVVRKSYEFALSHVGQDKDSGEIWSDYIAFLKSGDTTTTWEEQQKMDSLRKVYHRAVQIPLDNVERLWQDLESFETALNRITAKKFMADLSPAHMQARTVLRQLVNHVGAIYPMHHDGGGIYLPALPTFNAAERALVGKWKAYLKWEESNPLEVEEKDRAVLVTRIQGVYRKAVIRMRYYTEIWFMAYNWTNSVGKHDEAMSILKAGMEANPSSYLLTFAYVEAQETKKEFADVHATYEKFLEILRTNLEVFESSSANSSFSQPPATNSQAPASNAPTTTADGSRSNDASFNTQSSDESPAKTTELQRLRTEYGLAWIMYMRFGRRAEGVKANRAIFLRARKDRWIPWEVYEAGALMEYHCSDDKSVASRIFERGLDTFGDEIEYVLRYLGFLISINDENNARALFERVIPNFAPDRARPLWERWARYEYQYGDLEAALKLEKRMAEVYTSDPPIKRLAQRHMYLGTDAIADRDLGFALARRAPGASSGAGSNSLGRTETSQSILSLTQGTKRAASPDHRAAKREDNSGGGAGGAGGRAAEYGQGHKRARPLSPPPQPARERETRWEPPARGRRFSPPPGGAGGGGSGGGGGGGGGAGGWEREERRGREPLPPPRAQQHQQDREREREREREDEKPARQVSIPPIISWFIGELPSPVSFDGPVFRTDDLLNVFRTATMPNVRSKSPPARGGGGRPPPDYGPYQGPNSGRVGRRY